MALKTAFKALAQMGPGPLGLYGIYQLGLRTGHYRRSERSALDAAERLGAPRALLELPDRAALAEMLGPDGRATLLHEADEILGGRACIFGQSVPLRLTVDGPLHHWTEYEMGKTPVPFGGLPVHDIKFLWEPARFGWALTLGRAFHLASEDKYAESFWGCFEEFADGNPPYLGPHWMNGQEVAIRLMTLLWAWQLFATSGASTPERMQRLGRSIAQHAARIPATLVYARSQNNNHLVTESAALYAAGMAFGQSRWQELGWHWLNSALQRQISSYGEYIQHSTNYHRLMLQSVLWADAVRRASHRSWPPATLQALVRASHWLFSMIDPLSGRAPNLGANDGALILPLTYASYDDFRPTVQAAARAFLRTGLPRGPWDELSLWLGLPAAQRTADSDAYMAEHLRGKTSWAYLRASRFPSRLSHMDQLHLDLWRGGENVALDAGTHLYNAAPPWDNPLVATRVHNTITVDGQDQMMRGGRFLTLDWFPAYSKSMLESDERIAGRMLAYHHGFRRLGIRHERVASVFTDEHWQVQDKLVFTRPGEHSFRLHWLLMDGEWSMGERGGALELRVAPAAARPFTVRIRPDARIAYSEVATSLVRAGELVYGKGSALPFEGWVSPTYGTRLPALSLAVTLTASKTFSIETEFWFE